MADLTGKSLGKYQLTERLGHGGMADVYKARHTRLDRDVTIKVLHSHLIAGRDSLERFEREARAVAALRHAHIVGIHDFDVDDGLYYMVMEYIDGGSLGDKLAALSRTSTYLPIEQVLSILRQVGEALDYAHAQGIIHRDIKPSNILLDSQGNAYLTDFGIARMVSATQFTATGALIGTPTYMSPEQGQGSELDATSDIYSLGIVLYEMLTGKTAFASDTPLAIIHKHIHEPLPRVSTLRPDLPAPVESVVAKAVAKERLERYATAREFAQALEAALTPEARARLDAANRPLASLPTMRVEEAQPPARRSELPTQAMSEQTVAELTGRTVEAKKTASPRKPEAIPRTVSAPRRPNVEASAPTVAVSSPPAPRSLWEETRRYWPVAAAILVALLAIALLFSLGNPTESGACANIDECMAEFGERMETGDLEGALETIDHAIATVPDDQHPPNAWLWCERASVLEEMGLFDEAEASRETCTEWERAGASSPIEGNACPTLEECLARFEELRKSGELDGSLVAVEAALEKVPDDAHTDFAWLWCERAVVLDDLGRHDEANGSRNTCDAWARGE